MNNAINDIRNTLKGTKSRITEVEDRISEIEDRMVEINESEREKEKWMKRNEDNLRDLQDNMKHSNIWIIGISEEDKKKDHDKILEEIIVENFPKTGKEIATQVQETQRVPNRINPRWNTPRHILIVMRVYVPCFFVSSQWRFGATDVKALDVSQLSGLDKLFYSS